MSVPATPAGSPAGRHPNVHHDVRNAWVSAALLPVGTVLVLAALVGTASIALNVIAYTLAY